MAYCRWSSNDFQCDVYCYESVDGGWHVHVAGRRHVLTEPLPPPVNYDSPQFGSRHQKVMSLLDNAELVKIGLPHDGESSVFNTPGAAAQYLEMLQSAGYIVPQYAIDALREEETPSPSNQ